MPATNKIILKSGDDKLSLKLFVTGASPNSAKAISNLKDICEKYFENQYELEIIDVYQQPIKASEEQIIALPMLLKFLPPPIKRFIGDLSDTKKVLKGLGINS
ncbi:circadian clock protein KaiB [Hanamia caeni]|jgi:circadian clock protein KaiB|uniref:Circadian clock protein KaiB n=1 Tax=Hanamia caeni TaxID=2294116 RepID=A0A3M9NH81_9BACT|nr:circadian clock KaiB family protein [Hanamia caeni]RNI36563.1 circadian clock protein KaiB [Hanamia caeni]